MQIPCDLCRREVERLRVELEREQIKNRRLRRLRKNEKERSCTDPLTKTLNRRGLEGVSRLLFATTRRRREYPISMIALDIDHFKRVNDTFGHPVGDMVLRVIAGVMKQAVRAGDVLARLGGEEFAILLPGTDLPGAHHLADRIREMIQKTPVRSKEQEISVTASLGVAEWRSESEMDEVMKSEETLEELLNRADEALYDAKRGGRNRVVCAQ